MRPKHIWTQIASRGRKREESRTAQVILDPSLELGSCPPLAIHQNKSSPALCLSHTPHRPLPSSNIACPLQPIFKHVRVEPLSNHGDLDFVCLYNVQVHPDLTKE
ncbi:hypothetical protein BLNAU_21084 [Blattamonas nauphoetae]|uniref:Uncharacterized protein n=1 Tax=Blattamonas nauphoetae TaxID=2049346 RepID=A0ABQ9WWY2_9EUKA|nr:hypothetical protein BLNAU_21084 [Blattamonas nauphoetae]